MLTSFNNPTRRSCFELLVYGGGGPDNEPGGQGKTSLSKSGYFRADNVIIATPSLLPMDLVNNFSASELFRKQTLSSGIFCLGKKILLEIPFSTGRLTFLKWKPREVVEEPMNTVSPVNHYRLCSIFASIWFTICG